MKNRQATVAAPSPTGALGYRLFVPPALDHTKPAPLIVALHGCNQTAEDFATGTGFDRIASQHGAIAVYPRQAQSANASGCWNWFLPQHQSRENGEPAAILALVADLGRRHVIDPSRIYVVGLSAGGSMAAILGEQAPDVFAGVGIMAGVALHESHDLPSAFAAMAGRTQQPLPAAMPSLDLHPLVAKLGGGNRLPAAAQNWQAPVVPLLPPQAYRRMRAMIWTGANDTTVSPVNAKKLADRYAILCGLDVTHFERERYRADSTIVRWRDTEGIARVELWTVDSMGHAWSGGDRAGSYTYSAGPDATAEMTRFFQLSSSPSKSA